MRKVDELFARYGESHRNPANKAIHWICVPLDRVERCSPRLWAWSPTAAYVGDRPGARVLCVAVAFDRARDARGLPRMMVYPLTLLSGSRDAHRGRRRVRRAHGSDNSSAT